MHAVIASVLDPWHFLARPPLALSFDDGPEEVYWELYRGRALDHTMTRRRQRFYAWNVRAADRPGEPLISVKWDAEAQTLFVTRGVLSFAHEAYDAGDNTIGSREAIRAVRELVAVVAAGPHVEDELAHAVLHAVVGTSRLPLTSLEAPLTEFALGQLCYAPGERRSVSPLSAPFRVRRLEFDLRSGIPPAATPTMLDDLREVFRGVSLSPYTGLVANALALLRRSVVGGAIAPTQRLDFLASLLTLQWRHLNAYDLVTFHHRGANYPDALLVDEVLRELLSAAEEHAPCLDGPGAQRRRRGLRAGWLLRALYAGLRVPEQPTSPGENQRVLPFARVPDEQITNPKARPRTLFEAPLQLSPAAARVLDVALAELPEDVAELGTALILDRPLGAGLAPGEPDRTPLFSHVARSRSLAARVLGLLRMKADAGARQWLGRDVDDALAAWRPAGIPLPRLGRPPRPGVVSLEDALQVADDFLIERTTANSVAEFVAAAQLDAGDLRRWRAVLPGRGGLDVYDSGYGKWLELAWATPAKFWKRRGVEVPAITPAVHKS
jgi:hypothetical protein